MNESSNRKNTRVKEKKKDIYSAVMICQIISAMLLLSVFHFSVKTSPEAYAYLRSLLDTRLFTVSDIADAVRGYFSTSGVWMVSGNNVTVVTDASENSADETAEILNGVGGADLEVYQAAENTSFAPIKATSPAIMPIEKGRYTSYFGYRISPITNELSFHTGIDIAAEEGTKIRAAYSGRVLKTGEDNRAGKYILIAHDDGFETFYCHCSEILVTEGTNTLKGETVAKVGSTGWSTGPHLHFEVRKNNIRYNPLYILQNDTDN